MNTKKSINFLSSLIIAAILTGIILILSKNDRTNGGIISILYVWIKLASIFSLFGGLILLVLRIFKIVHHDSNFIYAFCATVNLLLGLGGIAFFLLGRINMAGLHDLAPNFLLGVIILVDILLFDYIFGRSRNK